MDQRGLHAEIPARARWIPTDNACAYSIANDTIKQRRSKAMTGERIFYIALACSTLCCHDPNELTRGPRSIIQDCTIGRPFRSLTMRSVVHIFPSVETSIGIMIGSFACQDEWKASVRKRIVDIYRIVIKECTYQFVYLVGIRPRI